eukprot:3269246-Amphidinium_carterae.1
MFDAIYGARVQKAAWIIPPPLSSNRSQANPFPTLPGPPGYNGQTLTQAGFLVLEKVGHGVGVGLERK